MSIGAIVRAGRGLSRVADEAVDARRSLDEFLNMSNMEVKGATQPAPDLGVRTGEVARMREPTAIDEVVKGTPTTVADEAGGEFDKFVMDDSLYNSPVVPKEAAETIPTAIEAASKGTKIEGMQAFTNNIDEGITTIGSDVPSLRGDGGDTAYLESKGGNRFSMGIGLDKPLRGTGEGTNTYQGVYAWAAQNDKVIVPDESGLSATNYVRKSAQVASSYLKAGKSSHVIPDPQVFGLTLKGIDTMDEVTDLSGLSNALVKYEGKAPKDFNEAKAESKAFLGDFEPENNKVLKDFDKYAEDYADTYKTYYNPDVEDSPKVAAQRANNLLVANMAATSKMVLGGKDKTSIAKLSVSKQNTNTVIEFTSDKKIKDPNTVDWKKFMVPVGSATSNLPFLEWLGKAAIEGRLGKGALPAVAGAAVATELYGSDAEDLQ